MLGRAANKERDITRDAVVRAPADQEESFKALSPKERSIWHEAVTAYAAGTSKKNLVFDHPLPTITMTLARAGGARSLTDWKLDPATTSILERAAPVYRKAWWDKHREANRVWQKMIGSFVDTHGHAVLGFIVNAYKLEWPATGFDVHLSAYTNWAGAYSTTGNLLVLSSLNRGTQGNYGLETIFHEGMHQWDEPVDAVLRREAQKLNKSVSDDLSHAVIFFTAGEAVRNVIPNHIPYAEKFGVWQRMGGL